MIFFFVMAIKVSSYVDDMFLDDMKSITEAIQNNWANPGS